MASSPHHLFHFSTNLTDLWFSGFSAQNTKDFAIVCTVLGIVCILRTCLACLRLVCFNRHTLSHSKRNHSLCFRIAYHSAGTIITILEFALGYMLMLAFMLGNVWLCIVIVGASAITYFFTFWSRVPIRTASKIPRITSEEDDNEGRDSNEMTAFLANPAAGEAIKLQPKPKPHLLPPDQRFSMEASHIAPLSSFQRDQQAFSPENETVDEKAILLARPDIISPTEAHTEAPTLELYPQPSAGTSHQLDTIPQVEILPPTTNDDQHSDHLSTPPRSKERSDSNPLLDKYPILRFHNVDIQDTSPAHETSKPLEFDELDKLIKDLQS